MALTLIEVAKTEQNELRRGVIETFAASSPILELMPFMDIQGNAYEYNQEEALPGIAFRAINEAFSESTGILNPQVEKLKTMGGDADTDLRFKRTQRIQDRRAIDTRMKIKAASLYFTKIFFDGDENSDARQITGVNKRLSGSPTQEIVAGADGAVLTENLLQRLIDAIDGDPSALLMSKAMRRQLYDLYKGSTIISEVQGAFGRTVKTYDDIPIRIIEKDNSGNEILGFDETQGAESEAGSIYAVRFGEDHLAGIESEALDARDLGEVDDKPVERTRIEWDIGIIILHPRSIARLKGVKKASGVN